MNKVEAKELLDKIIRQAFGVENPLTLEQAVEKFTFDIRMPYKVVDSTDGSETWATSNNPTKFVKMDNARNNESSASDGLYATQPIADLGELLSKWDHINFTTTEHALDSLNVAESDLVTQSENVFHSTDVHRSKNVIYSDGAYDCEFIFASQGPVQSTFCIRSDNSVRCANSFGITRSADLTNCIMMHDCGDMQDSMFCTNMKGKQYCIANMQFEKEEYEEIKKQVVQWILTPTS